MPRVPGVGWYALSGVVFLAGLTLAAFLVWRCVEGTQAPVRFAAPGMAYVTLGQPGEYLLWQDEQPGGSLPERARYLVESPDGRQLVVERYTSMKWQDASGRSASLARFEAPVLGTYRISVEGRFEPRLISVAPNRLWAALKLAGVAFAIAVLALGLSVALALYGFLRTVERSSAVSGGAPADGSMRKLAELVYGLQAASLLVGVTLFAGVIINYLRRQQAAGTWVESHFTWQIRTFWWSLAWCLMGMATAIVLVGLPILAASAVWFVYRIAKGWTELNEGRPMYT